MVTMIPPPPPPFSSSPLTARPPTVARFPIDRFNNPQTGPHADEKIEFADRGLPIRLPALLNGNSFRVNALPPNCSRASPRIFRAARTSESSRLNGETNDEKRRIKNGEKRSCENGTPSSAANRFACHLNRHSSSFEANVPRPSFSASCQTSVKLSVKNEGSSRANTLARLDRRFKRFIKFFHRVFHGERSTINQIVPGKRAQTSVCLPQKCATRRRRNAVAICRRCKSFRVKWTVRTARARAANCS